MEGERVKSSLPDDVIGIVLADCLKSALILGVSRTPIALAVSL